MELWAAAMLALAAAVICAALVALLRPLLLRYALARPNARSSHREPTPQGGGIAVVAATLGIVVLASFFVDAVNPSRLGLILVATAFLALVGAWDDIHVIAIAPRLILQVIAVGLVLAALPAEIRVFSFVPFWAERILLLLGGLWFVNLVNFMDGIDWMMVAEVIPMASGLALLGTLGALPMQGAIVAIALGGAMIGFAPFNRPVAKLFLGDVGSLPIGLLLGWLLLLLAAGGNLAAAILLPLYFLADATVTLLRRLWHGKTPWHAHRDHFYQRAVDNGFTASEAVARIFVVNVVLAALAAGTVLAPSPPVTLLSLGAGAAIVTWLLVRFENGKRCRAAGRLRRGD